MATVDGQKDSARLGHGDSRPPQPPFNEHLQGTSNPGSIPCSAINTSTNDNLEIYLGLTVNNGSLDLNMQEFDASNDMQDIDDLFKTYLSSGPHSSCPQWDAPTFPDNVDLSMLIESTADSAPLSKNDNSADPFPALEA